MSWVAAIEYRPTGVERADDRRPTDITGSERDLAHDERRLRGNRIEQRGGLELIHGSVVVVDTTHTRGEIDLVGRCAQLSGLGGNQEARRETHRYLVAYRRVAAEVQDEVHGELRSGRDL